MKFSLALLAVLAPMVAAQLRPENRARPSRRGYSTISGVCDAAAGAYDSYSGEQGTLRACTKACDESGQCAGLNFQTDQNQCTLFSSECDQTRAVGAAEPNQNFYLKGEIACATSTVGSEFYLAFMANRVAQPREMDLEIWVTQDSNLEGSTVRLEGNNVDQVIEVPYKTAVKATIGFEWKLTDIDEGVTIERKGLRLSSDDDFVFYGVNKEYFTADAYLGVPSRALGTRYVANCHWPSFYNCEFAFTPTEDDTEITVTLPRRQTTNTGNWARPPGDPQACNTPYQGATYTNGQSFTIRLNQFEVAQIQDPCDLTGAIIESNKPIAFWSGDSRVNIGGSPSRDHQVEQLFSTDTWGTDCAAWPTPNRAPGLVDYWVITAAEDGTRVRIDSNEVGEQAFDLNAGESVRFPANSVREWQRFTSEKKFQAVKYASSAVDSSIPGDPAMTTCIPSDQFGFGYTFVTPTGVSSTYNNYLSLITEAGRENGFILDGQPVDGIQWEAVPNSNLVGGYVQLDSSRQQFRIEHRVRGTRFEAYIYGAGDRESIAYPTGACIQALGECRRSTMFVADGKDNDCDGVVDEEVLDGVDNDFDGEVDEDVYRIRVYLAPTDRCPEVKQAQACYGSTMELSCDDGTISIVSAHFGRLGRGGESSCGAENQIEACSGADTNCGFQDISASFKPDCQGQNYCTKKITYQDGIAPSKCAPCSLYAHVQYTCLNQKEQDHGILGGSNYHSETWLSAGSTASQCQAGQCSGSSTCSFIKPKPADVFHPSQAAFTASSQYGWCPADCDKDDSWLQVDLGGQFKVGWYAIAGCRKDDAWTSSFGISYSSDGETWTAIRESNGALKSFTGNSDAINVHVCTIFAENIVARWIRIHPLTYNMAPCTHIDFGRGQELQGCSTDRAVSNSNFAQGGSAAWGQSAQVKCDKGWATARGESMYEVPCDTNGDFQGSFPHCNSLRTCPDIPRIDGGYAVASNTLVGSVAKFVCQQGYRLQGKSSVTCQENGQWSDAVPYCEQL